MNCSVCGFEIEDETHGPYNGGRYVCDTCWRNNSLYFPDKKRFTGSFRFKTVQNGSEDKFIYPHSSNPKQEVNDLTQVSKYRLNITSDRTIEADLMDVPLDDLELDPKNIRFKHMLEPLSQDDMIDWIWNDSETKKLFQQIKFSEGLQEQPLVDSNFVVKEGNMRTVCLLKLREDILSGKVNMPIEKIDPVRVIVLPETVSESEIAIYLTRVHVSGKREWRTLNQAAQVYDLYHVHSFSYDKIAESCGMGKTTAMRYIDAYEKNLSYHDKYPDDHLWMGRFSYFYELLKKKKLKAWAEDSDNLDCFMQWIYTGQIKKGAEVRQLPDILDIRSAYNGMVKGGSLLDALKIVEQENPSVTSKSYKAIDKAIIELKTFPRNELIDTLKNPAKMKMLETLQEELENLINDIRSVSKK